MRGVRVRNIIGIPYAAKAFNDCGVAEPLSPAANSVIPSEGTIVDLNSS